MIKALFPDHPGTVDETCGQHFIFAMSFAGWFLAAGDAAFAHALVPTLFETTASRILKHLNHKIETRHQTAVQTPAQS